MNKDVIIELVQKYIPPGFMWGSSFLLSPEDAQRYLDDMESAGIGTVGIECWRRSTVGDDVPVEDWGHYLAVSEEVRNATDSVSVSNKMAKAFIENQLLSHHVWVMVALDIPSPLWLEAIHELKEDKA